MNIVRAKSADNNLEVLDNRPFAIDIQLELKGFICKFIDLTHDLIVTTAFYKDRKAFDEEWEICDRIDDRKFVRYESECKEQE